MHSRPATESSTMKAKRLRDAECRNPEYDRQLNKERVADGLPPIPHTLTVKKGEVLEIEHPGLCLGPNPALEPADDECRAAVMRLLENPQRKQELQNLKRMYELREQLTPERRKYVEQMFEKHASEIHGDTPIQVTADKRKKPKTA
jgi:hypothetical protein